MKEKEMKKLRDLFNLKNRIAIVTGGLGHLGFAMTETLLELEAQVIVTCTKEELKDKEAQKKLQYLKNNYRKVSASVIDFADKKSVVTFFGSVKKVDILINNAVVWSKKVADKTDAEIFDDGIDGTLSPVFLCSKLFFSICKGKGVIINIGSMYGVVSPDWRIYEQNNFSSPASYAVAKAGVIQLTKYLASYWSKYGMRVNSISPGSFPKKNVIKDKFFHNSLKSKTMLGRIGEPEDLKGIVALLSSDASSYVTGQNFIIDGGWTAW